MVIAVTLAVLFLIFFLVRRHSGASHLAMIAGLSVYELFANEIHNLIPSWDLAIVDKVIYLLLILGFPILLYFRSAKGGMHGLFHIAESAIFAVLLTTLVSPILAEFFPMDSLAGDINNWMRSVEGYVVLAGIIAAYFDILMYRSEY